MKKCPICGHKIEDQDEICPYCENLKNDNKEKKSRKICLFLFLIIVLILFLTGPIIYFIIP
ncbi:MAG: DUF2116 family Zn-ribbon domain-containing protein [Promethearchaeota archaeon]